ncbi:hypothetical protein BXU08_10920 [Sphingomonas sp. LM7]|nr:hypothetical protein BXU08_10920 [Sphingomonas sp. LM7]
MGNGRTRPALLICENGNPSVEVVAKLAAGCDQGVTSLSMEVVSALLAGDLGIPIPEPFLLQLDPDFIDIIPNAEWAGLARTGCGVAFGSRLLPSAYSAWISGTVPVGKMTATAAGILLFDAVIENPDRRAANPNCLVRGEEIRIFDHELAFPPMLIGVPRPWILGALNFMEQPGQHIFRDALKGREVDWNPILASWQGLSNAQFDDYEAVLPPEWEAARGAFRAAIDKIKAVRENIEGCVAEVRRVLS